MAFERGGDIVLERRNADGQKLPDTIVDVGDAIGGLDMVAGAFDFVVVYEQAGAIFLQAIFQDNGSLFGDPVLIAAADPLFYYHSPRIAIGATGNLIVTYESQGPWLPSSVVKVLRGGTYSEVETAWSGGMLGAVATLADGGFVHFITVGEIGVQGYEILGQRHSATGGLVGDPFIVASSDVALGDPSAVLMDDGRIMVSYLNWSRGRVEVQIVDPREGTVNGSLGADTLWGNEILADQLTGRSGNDVLFGLGGADRLDGGRGGDAMHGGSGDDYYIVNESRDRVIEYLGEGFDTVSTSLSFDARGRHVEQVILRGGGAIDAFGDVGTQVLIGNSGTNVLNGRQGADRMVGGGGSDTYHFDNAGDVVTEVSGGGSADTVKASVSHTLAAFVERLVLTGSKDLKGTGNSGDNHITGNSGANVITGGGGADQLTGGGGADRFVYKSVSQSAGDRKDTIKDLQAADRIDLSAIDADTTKNGNQAFVLVDAFTEQAGQITLTYKAGKGYTELSADVDGDGVVDMKILLTGNHEDFTNFVL